jgi:Putative peptidase family
MDGNLMVHHDKDSQAFPSTSWPVSDSYFKALVYLSPGWNQIRFDFTTSSLSKDGTHSSYMMLNYLPLTNSPPLQLAVIVGKDSPCTYDAVPERKQKEGNGLETALRKYRMAAHLWQAFTAEQMYRNKFGRRCFQFEEEWQTGTLSLRDWEAGNMKNEIKIHVIRSDKTVAEIQDLQIAQQYAPAKKKGDLYSIASDAIKNHFRLRSGQKQYVAAMFLDSHWDPKVGTIRGHAALGGTSGDLQLAIFGSQALQSYPSCIEEVVPAFMDCTRTDTRFVANDCNEGGSNWEAVNIGIGAHMHEVGHLFGCPHQESGVMLRDYVRLNRTFLVREPYSTRTQAQGLRICRMEDECGWHRLDVLRFRHHPCFRTPVDSLPLMQDDSIQFYPMGNGKVTFSAPTGISFIEIYPEGGDETCRHWLEYVTSDPRNGGVPYKVTLSEADIRSRLPETKRKGKWKLEVFSGNSKNLTINDFCELLSKSYMVTLPARRSAPRKDEGLTMNTYNKLTDLPQSLETRQGFRGKKLGYSQLEGSKAQEIILDCTNLQTKLLTSIKIYSGYALDGMEFCYEDGHTQLFGKRGGKPGGDEFCLGQYAHVELKEPCANLLPRHSQRRNSDRLLCTSWIVD